MRWVAVVVALLVMPCLVMADNIACFGSSGWDDITSGVCKGSRDMPCVLDLGAPITKVTISSGLNTMPCHPTTYEEGDITYYRMGSSSSCNPGTLYRTNPLVKPESPGAEHYKVGTYSCYRASGSDTVSHCWVHFRQSALEAGFPTVEVGAGRDGYYPPCPKDTDGDGILDWFDPLPDDPRPFSWKLAMYGGTDPDDPSFATYEIIDGDGKKTYYSQRYRPPEEGEYITVMAGSPWRDSGDWPKDIPDAPQEGGQSDGGGALGSAGMLITPGGAVAERSYAGGVTGGASDLADIAANTKATADNQMQQGRSLEAIQKAIQDQTGLLAVQNEQLISEVKKGQGTGGSGVGPSAESIGSAVADALSGGDDGPGGSWDGSAGASGMGEAMDGVGGIGIGEGDIPEGYATEKEIDDYLDGETKSRLTGLMGKITGSGLQSSGSCSASFQFHGRQIDLSVCPYEGSIAAWGQVVKGIAGLCGLLIIFWRRG